MVLLIFFFVSGLFFLSASDGEQKGSRGCGVIGGSGTFDGVAVVVVEEGKANEGKA